ncbi:MAG: M48 family metalloprotease [Candidatus Latescibacteria bacterium]|nr:M48 family metalloprotease [Candidatus Latescibacterota bacterium]
MIRYWLLTTLWATVVWGAVEEYTIKRPDAVLRQGPGSYFAVVAELPVGALLEVEAEERGWYKGRSGDMQGYVSKKATLARGKRDDIFGRMGAQRPVSKVSQHGVSAGIKGFAEKVLPHLKGGEGPLQELLDYRIDAAAYQRFRASTYASLDLAMVQADLPLPPRQDEVFFTFSEQGMGLAVASRIGEMGLYRDPDLQAYLNYVGQLVVEAGEAYDTGFKFFILDHDSFNAMACPGGLVFVTRGLLQGLRSEAELACVLGHEIAHISRYHGMREMEKRKVRIVAEDAFAELAAEVEPAVQERLAMERELEQIGLDIYERLVAGRLAEYEEEADAVGLLYAARAGYDPRAVLALLARQKGAAAGANAHYGPTQINERLARLQGQLQQMDLPPGLRAHAVRFTETVRAGGH